ncbi:hypothetical protein [Acetobacter malorum]|uniref:hypothetical protein n=1 Tax=Acetobacter malorum TaxID=178901 RepID=UPI0039E8F61D
MHVTLTVGQEAALLDFAFNLQISAQAGSTLLRCGTQGRRLSRNICQNRGHCRPHLARPAPEDRNGSDAFDGTPAL